MIFKEAIKNSLSNYLLNRYSHRGLADDHKMLTSYPRTALTKEEKEQVCNLWGQIHPHPEMGLRYYEIQKAVDVFDERLVAGSVYYPLILRSLNPKEYYKTLIHKSLFRHILSDLPQPITLASSTNRSILDIENKPISKQALIDFLLNYKKDYIIKKSVETSGGRGVQFIKNSDRTNLNAIIESFGDNFVIQEIISGSKDLEKFNPSSLNTLRISTLMLNGEVSLCACVFRVGAKGQILDNLQQGGLMIGIDTETGRLKKNGLAIDGTKETERNGFIFEGFQIPNFDKVIDAAFEGHRRIAPCALASWDFALDINNTPRFIEVNLYWPGIRVQQLAGGPIFQNRTQEVIDFVKDKKIKNRFFFIEKI
ncbi:MAG: hypothetical protein K2L45_06645 [Muribaculaceae bacterium]|nr:hypothetical protein [Muribaculaceae bacterium]